MMFLLFIALVGLLAYVFKSYVGREQLLLSLNEELKERKNLFNHIFNESPLAIIRCDSDGKILSFSPSFLSLYKVMKNELDGKTLWDFIDPDYQSAGKAMLRQCIEDKKKLRDVLQTRNTLCEQLWSQVDIAPYEQEYLVVLTNITSSIKNQELLEKFQRGLDRVQILSITDRNGIISYVNDSFSKISGYEPQEIVGRSHSVLKSGEHDREFYENMWTSLLAGKTWRGQIKNRTKYDETYWVSTMILPFTDESGTPVQFVSVSRDITSEKVAEENLLESLNKIAFENRIWKVIDRVQTNMIVLRDEADMIQILLQIVCEDLGWDFAQIYRRDLNAEAEYILSFEQCFSFDPHKKQSLERCLMSRDLKFGDDLPGLCWEKQGAIWYNEMPIHMKSVRPLDNFGFRYQGAFCIPVFVNQSFYGVIEMLSMAPKEMDENITRAMLVIAEYFGKVLDRKNHETREHEYKEQLAFSAKMSTLGEMASGIAHEINSPLAIVMGYAGQALSRLEQQQPVEPEQLKRIFERIVSTSHRIGKIVKGLRSFARDGSADPFATSLVKSIIEDSVSICESKIKKSGVPLTIAEYDEMLAIDCRSVQISQILINLISNSIDAVEGTNSPWIRMSVEDHGDFVEFRVIDSGHGIPESVAQKIMQPFFTTKATGKGTGLGLSIARGIADTHNGTFGILASEPNTTFYLRIPKKQTQQAPSDFSENAS